MTIVYTVADAAEFVRWVLKFGAEAEIVGPPEVRALAGEIASSVAALYES